MFYKLVWIIAGILFKPFFFLKYVNREVVRENCPKGGFIIAANHINFIDPVFIACALKRPVRFMAKKELFEKKFLKWIVVHLNAFPVDRSKADITAIKTALSILKNGEILGIFPEGTRVAPGESQDAKLGTVQFAVKTKCPIVPVGIHTKGSVVKLFRKVTITFGEPIMLDQLGISDTSSESLHKASDIVMEKIRALAGNVNE